jgi:multidrug resistance efflux pump
VRSNLGITFATVERRHVTRTIRVPGRFELPPNARREHRTPLNGRVELAVEQYAAVEEGDVLYRLDSPDWREIQRELADARAAIDIEQARLDSIGPIMEAHRLHETGLREAVDLWSARVRQLEELAASGGGRAAELAQARASLTTARAAFGEVLEKDAELTLRKAETASALRSATAKFDLLLSTAAALHATTPAALASPTADAAAPAWSRIPHVEVCAVAPGVVERVAVTNGGWAEEGDLIVSLVDPARLRFRAVGMQSDLARLDAGLPAAIVPVGSGASLADSIPASIRIGLDADPDRRTFDLLATPQRVETWTRPGVSAFLEVVIAGSQAPELAIPRSAIVQDGLTSIIFRRDPANPDKVIRLEADLGESDGRWVVLNSGVKAGDEVVLDGAYQLLLATSTTAAKGGHFHADGTFHAEDHE